MDSDVCRTASCVVIGNEILSGKIQDTNSHLLARWLRARGIDLIRIQVIPDVIATIAAVVAEESGRSGAVLTSGGVGPTHDDMTYQGVAAAFGLPLRRHPEIVARMERFHGAAPSEVRLRMAELPEPASLHFVDGLWVPVVQVRNVFVLPGVPMLFERMLNRLSGELRGGTLVTLHNVFTMQSEEELAPMLEEVLRSCPDVEIGSYPRMDRTDHRVRVTIESRDAPACTRATDTLLALLDPGRLVRVERG